MIQLDELVDLLGVECGNYPAVFIINKPRNIEHVLFCNLNQSWNALQRLLYVFGEAPVSYVELDAAIKDARGSYSGTKIIIEESDGFFPMNDSTIYDDGFIDFTNIESGNYSKPEFYTYKDMGFYMPGKNLRIPSN